MNTMRYLCSLFGASTDDLVTAETPAGLYSSQNMSTYLLTLSRVPDVQFTLTPPSTREDQIKLQ